MQLHKWQSECLDRWEQNAFRGIINAVTGSGKTVLALSAISHLEEKEMRDLRVKIVVPQTFLASQWKNEIRRQLGVPSTDIGVYSGKRKEHTKKYMIYVINSARYSLARHILTDLNNGNAILLIADECHHYGSVENNRIFDFYNAIEAESPYYAMGLSATPEIADFRSIAIPLGQEIYSYDLKRALYDKIISRFVLFNIKLNFSPSEREKYELFSLDIFKCLASLRRRRPDLVGLRSGVFFAKLQKLTNEDGDCAQLAQTALALMHSRRTLCHMARERSECAIQIVKSLPPKSRIILFCERIQAATLLHTELSGLFNEQVGLYHSQMVENSRKTMLEQYEQGSLRILICCKALDEGLNIPSTDVGIIVSTSMSARQRVQRIGRMLRFSKEIKRIYFLHIAESSEDVELSLGLSALESSVPLIALHYKEQAFVHPEYERLRRIVIDFVQERKRDKKLISVLKQNINLALLRGDFLVNETTCAENIQKSTSNTERNYWISVLYIIHARLGKLASDNPR